MNVLEQHDFDDNESENDTSEEEENDDENGSNGETEAEKIAKEAVDPLSPKDEKDEDCLLSKEEIIGLDGFQIKRLKKKKEEEHAKMKAFAEQNGFDIKNLKKKGGFVDTYDALDQIKITPEMMKERRRRMLIEAMPRLVAPAYDLMKRDYFKKEPVRTGFN